MASADTIVPARFLVTVSHLIATIMAYSTKDGNIRTALPLLSTDSYAAYNSSMVAALALTWICFATEFAGLFSGRTMFSTPSNALLIAAHTAGTVVLCMFITEGWHYLAYWYIFLFCSLLPGIVEAAVLARSFV